MLKNVLSPIDIPYLYKKSTVYGVTMK